MPIAIPAAPNAITPDWLTQALRADNTICTARVTAVSLARIGENEGFTGGDLYLVTLAYDQIDQGAPATLVAKLSPVDPEMRAIMRVANGREVGFYRSLGQGADLPVPQCYHADFDPETGASILLLQDLTGRRSVPFLKGCGPADAKSVVEALAAIHAKWWNNAQLADLSGAAILQEFPFASLWPGYPEKARALLQGVELPASFVALGDHIARHETAIFHRLMEQSPMTRLHRDIQVDNVMFGTASGHPAATLVDWQLSGKGRGANDLAYFLISSLEPAQRRDLERGLVAHYHDRLMALGVTGYSLAQCWSDCLQAVAVKLFITVAATVLLDNASPHKTAWRAADLRRLLAFCADHSISEQTLFL